MGRTSSEHSALLPPAFSPLDGAAGSFDGRLNDKQAPLASDVKTFVNAVVAFLGTGVLGFSSAFMKTGIALGLVLVVAVGALSGYCMLLLVDCKYLLQKRGVHVATYGEIGHHALGPSGQRLVEVALVLAQAGFGVGFLIFIAANVHSYFGLSREAVIAFCTPFLVGFAMIKHVNQLAYVAMAASAMNLCGLTVVYITDMTLISTAAHDEASNDSQQPLLDLNWVGSLAYAPFFFGVATYCFSGIGMVLPLENSMRHKSHFSTILTSVVVLVGFIYASFGICGYLAFGSTTQDVLLLNLRGLTSLASAVDILFCASVFFGYPIMLFPVFDAVQSKITGDPAIERGRWGNELRISLFRASVVGMTAIIAAAIPNFAPFISFVGSTCCSLLGFVLPVVFYLRLSSDAAPTLSTQVPLSPSPTHPLTASRRRFLHGVMLFGILALVAGVGNAAKDLV